MGYLEGNKEAECVTKREQKHRFSHPKHTRDSKNAFYVDETGQNVQIFEESLLFNLRTTVQQKRVKPTYLVSV